MTDIYNNPSAYLSNAGPYNVTGYVSHCAGLTGSNCTKLPNSDSFMWYDVLHPSEQTDRVIAKAFADVVEGNSTWATYWGP